MIPINITYLGQLRCIAEHGPSGAQLTTDAPVDNHGRGEAFSPTDLLATALGSCMATVMGIVAQRKELDLTGMHVQVEKHMADDLPRRVGRLVVHIAMPIAEDHAHATLLRAAALECPVARSLHPQLVIDVDWTWLK